MIGLEAQLGTYWDAPQVGRYIGTSIAMHSTVLKKLSTAYQERRLWPALKRRLQPYIRGLKYLVFNPAGSKIQIHCPSLIEPNAGELATVERIYRSFKKMKAAQKKAADLYLPSSLWQEQLDDAYSALISGAENNDIYGFHHFLSNFGAWKRYTGVEESTFIRSNASWLPARRYLQNEIFFNLLQLWKHFYAEGKSVQNLCRPNYGNLSGAYVDGVLVTVDSFFSEIYGSLLSGVLRHVKRPVVAELGGGCGRLAYYTVRDMKSFVYVDFDLPETLCLASYYLMSAFPAKRFLLYGEEEYSPKLHNRYDFIFMPSYEMQKLEPSCVDLFINECSLGEMTQEAATNYVDCITRSTRYFFHMNHERYRNGYSGGGRSLLGFEYPVPDDQFALLFRYPELKHMLFYNGTVDFTGDTFLYLYERYTHQHGC